jgi:alkaline phosphatase
MFGTSRTRIALVLTAFLITCLPLSALAQRGRGPLWTSFDDNDVSFYKPPTTTDSYPQIQGTDVRNVIFMIGDGMGLGEVALARIKAVGTTGKLNIERLPVTGLVRTHSADNLVTDSSAAATAMACGIKTRNGMVGITPDGARYESLLEAAKARGMTTGLVATSTITHATPASFASHIRSRNSEDRIAEQLLAAKVNVLLGGGRKFFVPSLDPNGPRKDGRNLIDEARQAGYTYASTAEELQNAEAPYVLGLFAESHLTTLAPEPPLPDMAKKAISLLEDKRTGLFVNKRGFFLMIEGSQIDMAAAKNDASGTVKQTLLFDQAIDIAVQFAIKDKHTLVIVTADHETGGLTIPAGNLRGTNIRAAWSVRAHTATPVPVYAFGPGSQTLTGVLDNTELSAKVARLMGLPVWPQPLK